jgi:hypothetical protein
MKIREVGYEYYSSLPITLSLLSLDRDDTNEEDYERYCVTCFAAELEEELDSQDKEERKIAKVHKRTWTYILQSIRIPSFRKTPRNPVRKLHRPNLGT